MGVHAADAASTATTGSAAYTRDAVPAERAASGSTVRPDVYPEGAPDTGDPDCIRAALTPRPSTGYDVYPE
jgi:hypothetical protein